MIAEDTRLHLEVIEKEEDFLALAPCWDALLEQSAIRTPFLTWDWVSLWWQCYRSDFALRIAVLRDAGGETRAIAPFVIGPGSDGGRRYLRHLTFMGGVGEIVSEGLDLIIPRGDEPRMAPLLAQIISRTRDEWDIVELSALHSESPNGLALRRAMNAIGEVQDRFAPMPSYIYELPQTWDEVMDAMSARTRRLHRANWTTLQEAHAGRKLMAGADKPASVVFEEMLRLHALRHDQGKSTFLLPRALDFHRQLLARWSPSGLAILPYIELDGCVAAARYGFTHFGRYWDYQTGFDPAYASLSLGKLSMSWTMCCALQLGLTEYDHLPGDQEHKRQRSTTSRTVLHLETFNPSSPRALAFKLLRSARRRVLGSEKGPVEKRETLIPASDPIAT